MQAQTRPAELDDATLAFAEHVFHAARSGDSVRLGHLLGQGMPADLRNHAGDSLLMLASYHGRLAATSVLLDHGADAAIRRWRAPRSRVTCRWSGCSSSEAPMSKAPAQTARPH